MKQFERDSRKQIVIVLSASPSLKVLRVTMDFFQHRYYKLYKILMTLIGHWPYQSIGVRCAAIVVSLSLGGLQLIPLSIALVKYRDDGSVLLDSALVLLFGAVAATKFIGFVWNSKTTLKLLNRISTDWHEWAQDPEVKILHQYAKQGRKMAIGYLVMGITNHTVFIIQPTIPKIIDVFVKNGSEPGKLPYPVDYYHLDIQKYYFYIIVFTYICIWPVSATVTTNGIMLICYVQHVRGTFAALGHRLERLGNNRTLVKAVESRYALDKKDIALIASCIDRHNDAIKYVKLIETSYSWTFFFTIGFGVILFNILGIQLFMRTNNPESIAKFTVFTLTLTIVFFIDCYISQSVTDHSMRIYFCIYNNQWYKLSLQAQKLLQFMVMRCGVHCQLTAGNVLVMTMRSFWLTSKTALSYLMLLHSMEGL